jgi:hypothetical protein
MALYGDKISPTPHLTGAPVCVAGPEYRQEAIAFPVMTARETVEGGDLIYRASAVVVFEPSEFLEFVEAGLLAYGETLKGGSTVTIESPQGTPPYKISVGSHENYAGSGPVQE